MRDSPAKTPGYSSPRWWPVVIDGVWILLFVALGLRSHHHGETPHSLGAVGYPFVVGAVVSSVTLRTRRGLTTPTSGLMIVAGTVAIAMVIRLANGQGTDVAFTLVASAFLTLFLVGWRSVVLLGRTWRDRRHATG
jgi:FtsH-binding integral membrane protein